MLVQKVGVGPQGDQDPADDDPDGPAQVQDLPAGQLALEFL